ncbi:hypothetical protein PILCRDRAFT_125371 [Piloderma croceum F 1598]|uniref:Uncharacterized protein n=1 Tax=Piloderma croceum (strain F 1598) TaxID=765440 RepID=A0A0C3BXN3_PILCF|nr:hypothetical protein PILCRDRAFT_125371 [Piloderma croceum F 1598]
MPVTDLSQELIQRQIYSSFQLDMSLSNPRTWRFFFTLVRSCCTDCGFRYLPVHVIGIRLSRHCLSTIPHHRFTQHRNRAMTARFWVDGPPAVQGGSLDTQFGLLCWDSAWYLFRKWFYSLSACIPSGAYLYPHISTFQGLRLPAQTLLRCEENEPPSGRRFHGRAQVGLSKGVWHLVSRWIFVDCYR